MSRGLCRAIQWMRLVIWHIPPPTPLEVRPPLMVRPSRYPLRAVQLPTSAQKEKVSPGRMSTPETRGAARARLMALFC